VTRGRFITFEGGEGSGKSTQAARLAARLGAVLTREPGGTAVGRQIRSIVLDGGLDTPLDPRAEALLMAADRAQHVAEVVAPTLARGVDVVSDRFSGSTLAYQGFGAGLPLERLLVLEGVATDGLRPDLTILLDLPAEHGLARKAPAERTRFEAEFDLAFHGRVRAGFLALAGAEPGRFAIVDASAPIDAVTAAVEAVADRLVRSGEPNAVALRSSG